MFSLRIMTNVRQLLCCMIGVTVHLIRNKHLDNLDVHKKECSCPSYPPCWSCRSRRHRGPLGAASCYRWQSLQPSSLSWCTDCTQWNITIWSIVCEASSLCHHQRKAYKNIMFKLVLASQFTVNKDFTYYNISCHVSTPDFDVATAHAQIV